MSIVNILNETKSHFDVDELKRDEVFEKLAVAKDVKQEQDLSAFRTYNVGGKQVIDLTSIDKKYSSIKLLGDDIERQQRYDVDKAWSYKWL